MVGIPSGESNPAQRVRNCAFSTTIAFGIALAVCGIVILITGRDNIATRITSNHVNDSALALDFGTGTLTYRVCNGSVPYKCTECSKSTKTSRVLTSPPATPAPPGVRQTPDAYCRGLDGGGVYCGADVYFDRCADRSDLLAACNFGDSIKTYASVALACCIIAFIAGGIPVLLAVPVFLFPVLSGDNDRLGAGVWLCSLWMMIMGPLLVGLSAPLLPLADKWFTCENCCSASVVSELGDREYDLFATQSFEQRSYVWDGRNSGTTIAMIVFAALYFVSGVLTFIIARIQEGSFNFFGAEPPPRQPYYSGAYATKHATEHRDNAPNSHDHKEEMAAAEVAPAPAPAAAVAVAPQGEESA